MDTSQIGNTHFLGYQVPTRTPGSASSAQGQDIEELSRQLELLSEVDQKQENTIGQLTQGGLSGGFGGFENGDAGDDDRMGGPRGSGGFSGFGAFENGSAGDDDRMGGPRGSGGFGGGFGGFDDGGAFGDDTLGGLLGGLGQQSSPEGNLLAYLQQLAEQQGGQYPAASGTAPQSGEPVGYAQSFDVKSYGDPHVTTNVNGQTSSAGIQTSLSDLVDLNDSIAGGYQVSTAVTNPDANGITHNKSASVTLDNGVKVTDTYNAAGSQTATLTAGNLKETLTAGQTVQLGQNESVSMNADGSLTIKANGYNGATVQTQITNNGLGLDVDTSGTNAYIGGTGAQQTFNSEKSLGGTVA